MYGKFKSYKHVICYNICNNIIYLLYTSHKETQYLHSSSSLLVVKETKKLRKLKRFITPMITTKATSG